MYAYMYVYILYVCVHMHAHVYKGLVIENMVEHICLDKLYR